MTSVLQVNVRYKEGGAARVARTLHSELPALGFDSAFVYGYGAHGGDSETGDPSVIRMTPRVIAAANLLNHRCFSSETKLTSASKVRAVRAGLANSDLVHLHVVHSYMANLETLVDLLVKADKPVVWTLHDQWTTTGRCAQPGGCQLWRSGCPKCPNLAAYPPAFVDRTRDGYQERRMLLRKLEQAVPVRYVACAGWLAEAATQAGLSNVLTIPNSVDSEYWHAARRQGVERAYDNLFICRDLRDTGKVDYELLREVALLPDQSLTIVGDHLQEAINPARRVPATADRTELAEIYLSHRRLIFTSRVDYYPLTIIEALTAGTEVLAVDSESSREFRGLPNFRSFRSSRELIYALRTSPDSQGPGPRAPGQTEAYAPGRMAESYARVYNSLLHT